ncbi:MAG TPA: hypothetical protein VNJ28_05340 [Candidatus Limnocylindrales bacterium]|nr:hypothetical protein [Candidatus Limnocylindrales bacterium]
MDALFVVLAAIAFFAFLLLTRGMTFYADEWSFIYERSLDSLDQILRPHNEHWSTIPIILYRVTFSLIGLRSYLPYIAQVLVLHLIVAAGVYWIVRRTNGPRLALIVGAMVLFLGAGFENLYWAFQTGFVASTAAGVWVIALLEQGPHRRRLPLIAGLLTAGLMCSSLGVVFLILAGTYVLISPGRQKALTAVFVPASIFLAWYIAYGRLAIATHRNPFAAEAIRDVPGAVAEGLAATAASLTGVGPSLGIGLVWLAALAALWQLAHGWRPPPRLVATGVGVVALYAFVGLGRSHLFEGIESLPRYSYVSCILALLGLSAWLGRLDPAILARWRVSIRAGTSAWLTLVVLWNGRLLVEGRELFLQRAEVTRAEIEVGLNTNSSCVAEKRAFVALYGSPLQDALAGDAMRPISPATRARVARELASRSGPCDGRLITELQHPRWNGTR